jgi:hypothetical protein
MKQCCIHAGDIWIPEQQQLVTAARPRMDLDSGVQILFGKLLESTFICIKPKVHIMSEPTAIILFGSETFFYQRCCDTLFWPVGPCIM